ncbi:MAG: RluA family pseudouridine synthase [Candidatus Riflebacteria bacterium]|nr:RluA family pseudouridine synthase [Candidatus Riflebacteria bacterium]
MKRKSELKRHYHLTVDLSSKGKRLDALLAETFPELSRSLVQEMIQTGVIKISENQVKPSVKVRGGEKIAFEIPQKAEVETITASELDFPILFEDEHIVVIAKPYGKVVHPGAGHEKESVVSALLSHTALSSIGAPIRPGVVHRLDKTTSGVMILAKTDKAHARLVKMFSRHEVEKEYLAIVQGIPQATKGLIEVAIERDRVNRKRMKATDPERGKRAVSRYEIVERFRGHSLVKVVIETGRTHQIRLHMAYIGHPLSGDVLYKAKAFLGKAKHFLHSTRLSLKHPITQEQIEWTTPLPSEFEEIVKQLRIAAAK